MWNWLFKILFKTELEIIDELRAELNQAEIKLAKLNADISSLNDQVSIYKKELDSAEKENAELIEEVKALQKQILDHEIDSELDKENEDFWNNKRPKVNVTYAGRPFLKYGNVPIDVRCFFNQYDSHVPKVTNKENHDEIARSCLVFVINNIKYTSDVSQEGVSEYWQFPYETMKSKKGDCEDGAILLANIMLRSGVPYWKIRLNAGDVSGGGHAYVTYLASDNKWYILDWCYWPQESLDSFKKIPWDERDDKYWGIWFSWNERYCFFDKPYDLVKISDFEIK